MLFHGTIRPSPPTGDENHWAGAQIGCPLELAKSIDAEDHLSGASGAAGAMFKYSGGQLVQSTINGVTTASICNYCQGQLH